MLWIYKANLVIYLTSVDTKAWLRLFSVEDVWSRIIQDAEVVVAGLWSGSLLFDGLSKFYD